MDTEAKIWYGSFEFAGYEVKAICASEKELDKVLRTEYYRWRKDSHITASWKSWKEDTGVHYVEVELNEIFGDHI